MARCYTLTMSTALQNKDQVLVPVESFQCTSSSYGVVECLTRDRRVRASPASLCCFLKQEHKFQLSTG